MAPYDAIAFDVDGVLLPDSERINIGAVTEIMGRRGFHLSLSEIASIAGRPSRESLTQFLDIRTFPKQHYDTIFAETRARYDELWDLEVTFAERGKETLEYLKRQGIRLGIATSNRRSVVEKMISRFGLEGIFFAFVTREDAPNGKGDSEIYRTAALRLRAKRCLAVEDTTLGLRSALGAKLDCAVIPNPLVINQDYSRATYILKSLTDLITLFQ